jgi:F0F1-type ATP synthase beta subunit
VTLQVVQRLPDGIVRCVVSSPAEALEPGMTVMSAGRYVQTPVSHELFDRSVRLLAGPPPEPGAPVELLETGIKVIDVMCPLVRGGTVAIAGELRAGTTVVMEELVRRLSGGSVGVSLFTLAPWTPVSIADTLKQDGFNERTTGPVQTFYFRSGDGAWTPERLAELGSVDVVIRLSAELAGLGIYPTVDPLTSRSRLLEAGGVDRAHLDLAARIRQALAALLAPEDGAPAADALMIERAKKLLRFFAQPFYVAEAFTKRSGVTVGLAESLRVCREILDGVHDVVPTQAFYFTGGLDAVLARAAVP